MKVYFYTTTKNTLSSTAIFYPLYVNNILYAIKYKWVEIVIMQLKIKEKERKKKSKIIGIEGF